MLVCLVCPKHAHIPANHMVGDHSDAVGEKSCVPSAASPSKEHIKFSFTTQLKDIVMKFSTGAYRHCRPCMAATVRGGVVDDGTSYKDDSEKSTILVTPNSQDQGMSDCRNHGNMLHNDDGDKELLYRRTPTQEFGHFHQGSCYGFLPKPPKKGHPHRQKKKAKTSQNLKQSLESLDAIEQLLNAHFQREEELLAEEEAQSSRGYGDDDDDDGDDNDGKLWGLAKSRRDHKLLDEAMLVTRANRHMENGDDNINCRVRKDRKGHVINGELGNSEEWIAQVEPGVMITFLALPDGSNHLKRIRFSQDMFSKWQAQQWWAENSEMVRELYSVSKSDHNNNNDNGNGRVQKVASASSSRSSPSCSSCSSRAHHHNNVLKTTLEMQSTDGSTQSSPSLAPLTEIVKANDTGLLPSTHLPLSHFLGRSSHESMEHHENPLFDRPEFELCYHEGAKSPLILRSCPWMCEQMERNAQVDEEDKEASRGGLLRELKRVRFSKQPAWTAP